MLDSVVKHVNFVLKNKIANDLINFTVEEKPINIIVDEYFTVLLKAKNKTNSIYLLTV